MHPQNAEHPHWKNAGAQFIPVRLGEPSRLSDLAGMIAGDTRDVGPADAEVVQGAIVQRIQFTNSLLVGSPSTKGRCNTHLCSPLVDVLYLGVVRSAE